MDRVETTKKNLRGTTTSRSLRNVHHCIGSCCLIPRSRRVGDHVGCAARGPTFCGDVSDSSYLEGICDIEIISDVIVQTSMVDNRRSVKKRFQRDLLHRLKKSE